MQDNYSGSVVLALLLAIAPATPARAEEATIPCLIEAHRTVKLATQVAGVLSRVLVDRGDVVRAGMVVAELSDAVEATELASARLKAADLTGIQAKEARRDFTEAKLNRLKLLRTTSQFVSATSIEEADADARQARAELQAAQTALRLAAIDVEHAEARLQQRRIVSPLSGIVTERTLSPGEYGFEQQSVLTVAELDPLNVEMFLPVSEYGRLKVGAAVDIEPQAPIGGRYRGTVAVIDRVVDSRSGTYGVRVMLPNPGGALPAGIRCIARPGS